MKPSQVMNIAPVSCETSGNPRYVYLQTLMERRKKNLQNFLNLMKTINLQSKKFNKP